MRAKYWLLDGCKTALMLLFGALIFSVIMLLQHSSNTFGDYLTEFTSFYLFFGALVQIILLQASYKLQIPLALSMGCTRKETHLYFHLYRLTFIAIALCIYSILSHLPGNAIRLSIFLVLGFYLALGAAGSGLGMVAVKLGNKAMIVVYVIFALLCGILGGFIGVGAADTLGGSPSHGFVPVLVLILGLVLHLVMTIPESKTVRNLVVKL